MKPNSTIKTIKKDKRTIWLSLLMIATIIVVGEILYFIKPEVFAEPVIQFSIPFIVSVGFNVIFRDWISEGIKASIHAEYERELEVHRRLLEIQFADQVKKRKIFEEFAMAMEEIFGTGPLKEKETISLQMNKLFGLLALYAPDDAYLKIKDALIKNRTVYGDEAVPPVYYAMRKSIFGDDTNLSVKDIVRLGVTHEPDRKSVESEKPLKT